MSLLAKRTLPPATAVQLKVHAPKHHLDPNEFARFVADINRQLTVAADRLAQLSAGSINAEDYVMIDDLNSYIDARLSTLLARETSEAETGTFSGSSGTSEGRGDVNDASDEILDLVAATGVVYVQADADSVELITDVANLSYVSPNLNVGGTVTGSILISDIAIGTPPLTVTSTTVVPNLNVDQLDNYHATTLPILGDVTGTLAATTVVKINGVSYNLDPLTQYALLAGRVGGQTLKGGTASGDDLVLESTNNATKGVVQLVGGHKITRTAVAFAASPYAVLEGDYYIGVDCSGGAVTLNLPVAATAGAGKVYIVKDESGNAAANPISVTPAAGDAIDGNGDGVAVSIAANYGSLTVVSNGADWRII